MTGNPRNGVNMFLNPKRSHDHRNPCMSGNPCEPLANHENQRKSIGINISYINLWQSISNAANPGKPFTSWQSLSNPCRFSKNPCCPSASSPGIAYEYSVMPKLSSNDMPSGWNDDRDIIFALSHAESWHRSRKWWHLFWARAMSYRYAHCGARGHCMPQPHWRYTWHLSMLCLPFACCYLGL